MTEWDKGKPLRFTVSWDCHLPFVLNVSANLPAPTWLGKPSSPQQTLGQNDHCNHGVSGTPYLYYNICFYKYYSVFTLT